MCRYESPVLNIYIDGIGTESEYFGCHLFKKLNKNCVDNSFHGILWSLNLATKRNKDEIIPYQSISLKIYLIYKALFRFFMLQILENHLEKQKI